MSIPPVRRQQAIRIDVSAQVETGTPPSREPIYLLGSRVAEGAREVTRILAELDDPNLRALTITLTKVRLRDDV